MNYSLKDVFNKIPKDALESFKNTFNPSDYEKIINSFRIKRKSCIRINSLKIDKSSVMKELQKNGLKFKNSTVIKDAFIFSNNVDNILLKNSLTKNGYIYLQNLSSMLPVLILSPKENERILDIAAAPGSKTTYIAAIMNNKGIIDAIEPNYIRMERLKHNSRLLGVKIINFHKIKGEKFLPDYENIYDKVLVDAPCSGEGRFNLYDKSSYQSWKSNTISHFVALQMKLLLNSIRLTKKNGIIVYSTCTLNIYENENVINNVLKKIDKVIIEDISYNFKKMSGFRKPFLHFKNETFSDSISKCLRILPDSEYEGFFICKLRKI